MVYGVSPGKCQVDYPGSTNLYSMIVLEHVTLVKYLGVTIQHDMK